MEERILISEEELPDKLKVELNILQKRNEVSAKSNLMEMIGAIQGYKPELLNCKKEWSYIKNGTLCCASDIIYNMEDVRKCYPRTEIKCLLSMLLSRYQCGDRSPKFASDTIKEVLQEIPVGTN